ncbi:hypothetical protein AB0M39_38275 [Streptomyces sp. NPDC051907]|uniref:hypothetical protein n=1 Tax=Streptomyces sp. NPDC051907 TaxID=3155284 RepID=UPI003414A3A1
MTVYTLHRLSLGAETVTPMEEFPSVERASVALQTRARKQASPAYFMSSGQSGPAGSDVAFPGADLTGYMVVWRRAAHKMPPRPTDTPDELWLLTESGAVRREAWDEEKHRMPETPTHTAVVPEIAPGTTIEIDLSAGRKHPPQRAMWITYWLNGRMALKEVYAGECQCGKGELHEREVIIRAAIARPEEFNLPEGTAVWAVKVAAPDPGAAQKLARTVAKGLGWDLNPVLSETEGSK